jgi:hypothetical protein
LDECGEEREEHKACPNPLVGKEDTKSGKDRQEAHARKKVAPVVGPRRRCLDVHLLLTQFKIVDFLNYV